MYSKEKKKGIVREKFRFGVMNRAIIIFKESKHNLFITLLDSYGMFIKVFTCGLEGVIKAKGKKSPFFADKIAFRLGLFSKELGIRVFFIILKMSVSVILKSFIRRLGVLGFKISGVYNNYNLPQNGVRKKKKRRV